MGSPIWLSLPMVESSPKKKDIVPFIKVAINDLWSDAVREFTEKGLATLIISGRFIDTGMAGANLIAPILNTKDKGAADPFIGELKQRIRRSRARPLLLRAGGLVPGGYRTVRQGLAAGKKASSITFATNTNFLLDFEFEVAVWELENIIQPKLDVVKSASEGFVDFFEANVFSYVNDALFKGMNIKIKEVKFSG